MNLKNRIIQITGQRWFPITFVPIAFLFVLYYSFSTSPLYVDEGLDSCVFKSMGLAILQGKTPYVDFFDHKGPILYGINALGQFLIPGRTGIFIIQIIGLSIVLFFLFKTARLFTNSNTSYLLTLLSFIFLSATYTEGNMCEDWELIAIAPSVFLVLKYLTQKNNCKFSINTATILGLCLGFVFFIRPNDAISQIGGLYMGLLILFLFRKQYDNIIRMLVFGLLAFLFVAAPILIWFASNNAIGDLFYGMIHYNSLYSEGIFSMIISSISPRKMLCFIIPFATCLLAFNSSYRIVLVALLPQTILALIFTGNRLYLHYFTVYLPLFLLFFLFLIKQKKISIIILSALFYCCPIGTDTYLIKAALDNTIERKNRIKNNEDWVQDLYREADKLFSIIPKDERDQIWNLNLMWYGLPLYSVFYHNSVIQCNRVPLYFMTTIDKQLKESDNIRTSNPKWIMLTHGYDSKIEEWKDFIQDYEYISSHYSFVASTNLERDNIELYRLHQ